MPKAPNRKINEKRRKWYKKNRIKIRKYLRKYFDTPKWKKWNKEYQKRWHQLHKEEINERHRKDYQKKKEAYLKRHKEYNQKNKRKIKARQKLYYQRLEVKKNKVKWQKEWRTKNKTNALKWKVDKLTKDKFKREPVCAVCKSKRNLQFHHWRYRLPVRRKDFSTLCKFCHGVQHGKFKPAEKIK